MSFGLRIVLIAALLVLSPLLLLRAILDMEAVSRDTAEQRLSAYAQAVASQLRGQQQWLHKQAPLSQLLGSVEGGEWFTTDTGMTIDGDMEDWSAFADRSRWFSAESLREAPSSDWQPASLSFRKLAAADEQYLYLLFIVKDAERVWRRPSYLRIDLNDHVELLLANSQGDQQRFLLAPSKPGRVFGQRMPADQNNWVPEAVDKRLRAEWVETSGGYIVEVRLPRELAAGGMAFSVGDMDRPNSTKLAARIGSTLSVPVPELASDLRTGSVASAVMPGLDQLPVRLRLLDSQRQFIASTGWPQARHNGHSPDEQPSQQTGVGFRRIYRWFVSRFLPIERHRRLVKQSSLDTSARIGPHSNANDRHILSAMDGSSQVVWQSTGGSDVWLLSAAVPVFSAGAWDGIGQNRSQTIGVVVAEQVVNQAQLLVNPIQRRWVQWALLTQWVVLLVVLVLLLHWQRRFNQILGSYPEKAGYRQAIFNDLSASDRWQRFLGRSELNGLQRRLHRAEQQRLADCAHLKYVEKDFTHALQGPLAEVATSLALLKTQMLATQPAELQEQLQPLVSRADDGIDEMQRSLDRLAEGDRLISMLSRANVRPYDAGAVCRQFVAAWHTRADCQIAYSSPSAPCTVVGVEELLTLLLRELLDNAAQHSSHEALIAVELRPLKLGIELVVSNEQRLNTPAGRGMGLYLVSLAAAYCGGALTTTIGERYIAKVVLPHQQPSAGLLDDV